MAELVVIGYTNEAEAQEVMGVLRALERELVIHTAGSAVVISDPNGELRVATPTHAAGSESATGALWGMVLGLLFFMPIEGKVDGGTVSTPFGDLSELGITDEFREKVATLLRPGTATVAMLFPNATPDRTIEALAPYGGTVLRTPLSREVDRHLGQALKQASSAATSL